MIGIPNLRQFSERRPGKARRGVKVGFRFQLQDWFTSASRQSPQVEKSQIRAHKEELDQRSSMKILTYFLTNLERAKYLLLW